MTSSEEEGGVNLMQLRVLFITYFWIEASLTAYFISRQIRHVDQNVGSMPPLLRSYKSVYNYETYALSSLKAKKYARAYLKIKVIRSALWTFVVAFDVIPWIWNRTPSFLEEESSSCDDFFSAEVKKDACFGFCFAVFEILVFQWIANFMFWNLAISFGCESAPSVVAFVRAHLEELLVAGMYGGLWTLFVSLLGRRHSLGILTKGFLHGLVSFILEVLHELYFDDWDPHPMEDGVKTALEPVCKETGYKLQNVKLKDDDEMNAFSFSLFRVYDRINIHSSIVETLNDTQRDEDWERKRRIRKSIRGPGLNPFELEGVFTHEVGHWALFYTEQILGLVFFLIGPIIFVSGLLLTQSKSLYDVFHFKDVPLAPGLLLVALVVLKWFDALANTLLNIKIRRDEAQADAYAAKMGRGSLLQAGLVKLIADSLQFPTADPLVGLFYGTHPSLMERLEGIEVSKPK